MAERVGDAAFAVERPMAINSRHWTVVLATKHPPAVVVSLVFRTRPLPHWMHHRDAQLVLETLQVQDCEAPIGPRTCKGDVQNKPTRRVIELVLGRLSSVLRRGSFECSLRDLSKRRFLHFLLYKDVFESYFVYIEGSGQRLTW